MRPFCSAAENSSQNRATQKGVTWYPHRRSVRTNPAALCVNKDARILVLPVSTMQTNTLSQHKGRWVKHVLPKALFIIGAVMSQVTSVFPLIAPPPRMDCGPTSQDSRCSSSPRKLSVSPRRRSLFVWPIYELFSSWTSLWVSSRCRCSLPWKRQNLWTRPSQRERPTHPVQSARNPEIKGKR